MICSREDLLLLSILLSSSSEVSNILCNFILSGLSGKLSATLILDPITRNSDTTTWMIVLAVIVIDLFILFFLIVPDIFLQYQCYCGYVLVMCR